MCLLKGIIYWHNFHVIFHSDLRSHVQSPPAWRDLIMIFIKNTIFRERPIPNLQICSKWWNRHSFIQNFFECTALIIFFIFFACKLCKFIAIKVFISNFEIHSTFPRLSKCHTVIKVIWPRYDFFFFGFVFEMGLWLNC